jgi:hypothetical protein
MNQSSKTFIQYVGAIKLENFSNAELRQGVQAFCEKQENEVCKSLRPFISTNVIQNPR